MQTSEGTKKSHPPADQVLLGGQAVIEGVMMRGPDAIAMAVRRKDGSITIHKEQFQPLAKRTRFWRVPVVRGIAGFFEMMLLGVRMLNLSASLAMKDLDGEVPTTSGSSGERVGSTIALVVSLIFAVGLFFVIPLLLTTTLFDVSQDPLLFNLFAGLIRLTIFLGYLAAIGRIPDVERLFMYHGAEHMTVFGYERLHQITVGAAAVQSRFHPRCGTSFLLVVVVASIVLFAFADTVVLSLAGVITLPLRLLWHLLLLPVVAGAAYEVIRFSAKHAASRLGRAIMYPGLLLQRLTTRTPANDQLEVAVAALRAALEGTGNGAAEQATVTTDANYA